MRPIISFTQILDDWYNLPDCLRTRKGSLFACFLFLKKCDTVTQLWWEKFLPRRLEQSGWCFLFLPWNRKACIGLCNDFLSVVLLTARSDFPFDYCWMQAVKWCCWLQEEALWSPAEVCSAEIAATPTLSKGSMDSKYHHMVFIGACSSKHTRPGITAYSASSKLQIIGVKMQNKSVCLIAVSTEVITQLLLWVYLCFHYSLLSLFGLTTINARYLTATLKRPKRGFQWAPNP